MAKKTKENPTGSPLGKFSVLNLVVKGIDALTGTIEAKNTSIKRNLIKNHVKQTQPKTNDRTKKTWATKKRSQRT